MPGFASYNSCFATKAEALADSCTRFFVSQSDGFITCWTTYFSGDDGYFNLRRENSVGAFSWIDSGPHNLQPCELLADVINGPSVGTAFITGFGWVTGLVSIAWIVALSIQMIRKA